ncbi:replicative DNA helicase [Mariprofundus micogutta]|uniref:Replicative DNA helicase n=1 Tax=Mariprofundus micogutta TaxID=1921010 RepID=A0A1L8CLX4_9PROT|nr:DnaB-like helicase C-terminal domain-containing protein [Mariprofundus micogutta]GAV19918.1 replicative DNA helicase [Mariprofundus micogutta]
MKKIEQSFIGSCLIDQDLIGLVSVKPDHFSDKLCSHVWRTMLAGYSDPVSVCREIGSEHEQAISDMIGQAYTSAAEKHGREIIEAHRKRVFMSALVLAHKKLKSGESVDASLTGLITAADSECDSEYRPVVDLIVDAYNDMRSRHEGTDDNRFMPSGYPDLDFLTGGLERGSLVTVAGRVSMGKTAFAMGMCQRVAESNAVCFSSIEMDNQSVAYRLMASISRMDLKLLRTGAVISNSAWEGAAKSVDTIKKLNFYIDDNPKRSASQIAAQARRHHAKKGLDLLMVDYLGLLDPESTKSLPRHLQVGEMTRIFKTLAKQLNCCVMLLCQLNREADGKRPTLAHLRESGSIEQDSDVIMLPYRYKDESNNDRAIVIVAKNRNGPTGDAPMAWVGSSASYESLAREDF